RGVGSSFKVYTYGAALQAGIVTPASLLNDQTGTIGGHSFSDWDGKHEGYITLRTALAESRNLPALWTYRNEGGDRVVSFMHNLGVTAQIENPDGVATTLGHDALSMSEHLAAYAAFDNGGYRVSPHAVLRITDASGKVLEALDASFGRAQVIGSDLAYVMTDLLRGPVRASVWRRVVEEDYASQPWPAMWAEPAGVVPRQVCAYDGGYVASGGYNGIFLKGAGEPRFPCGANPYPGQKPYAPPAPASPS